MIYPIQYIESMNTNIWIGETSIILDIMIIIAIVIFSKLIYNNIRDIIKENKND